MSDDNEPFNIADLFFAAAKKCPNKPAIIFRDKSVSFNELENQVKDTAQFILNKGIGKGDRILVFVPMSIDLYRIVLAIFKIGATAVFLDEWVSWKRMEECCKVAQCKAFIGISKARVLSLISAELRKIPVKLGRRHKPVQSKIAIPLTQPADIALITFTTGTTATPKAALRTHGFLYHQFKALEQKIDPAEDDISMAVLPIVLLINLATGTSSVIADFKASKPNLLNPGKVIQQIKQHAVNNIIASPFFVKKIAEHIIKSKVSVPRMKKVFTGGAPVFPAEAAIYNEAFPDTKIEVVYGSTEAEPISSINIKDLLSHQNTVLHGLNVGKVAACAEVKIIKIIDESIRVDTEKDLDAITLPANETGEIIVSGDHVLRQYLNNEEALKRNKISIGQQCWHRTGDSGYLDETGNLFLTGRCSTLIYKDGQTVYPFIYENYFSTISGVEIGTVIMLNGKITAFIELNDLTKRESAETAIKAGNNTIEQIIFLKKIPRDPRHNSKIDYQKLGVLSPG